MAGLPIALAMLAAASSPTHKQATCPPLRIMTYNIRLDLQEDGINKWSERRDQFTGQIGLMHPAILGLQEVVPGQKADLQRALPNLMFLGLPRETGGEAANLAFDHTIFKLRKTGTFWLSPTPNVPSKGWDSAYSRVATWAHLIRRSDGKKFLALNTHLDNEGQQARLEGARQIVRFLAANRTPGEAVLMTGDMNTEPNTPPLKELTSARLGLRDSKLISKTPPVGPDGTWNDFHVIPADKDKMRIDFVLVDPTIDVERYGVLAWHFENHGERAASDHFPVVADLNPCAKQ
jgi:endonuclease/exonuclease/phosphatase family metal-dependent hydrolase